MKATPALAVILIKHQKGWYRDNSLLTFSKGLFLGGNMGKKKNDYESKKFEKGNKKIKKGKSNSISMEKFLREHCGLDNEDIIFALTKLSHQEFKEVCQRLYNVKMITVPFEVAFAREHFNNGDFITVRDVIGNEAPYVNPCKKRENQILDVASKPVDTSDLEEYEVIIDMIEENMTNEDADISGIGSFDLPKVKKIGGR